MTTPDSAWRASAACRPHPTAWFFPEPGTPGDPGAERARQVCASCSVREACLTEALATREPYGIWGGLTPTQRRRLPRDTAGEAA